jgi:hypothetical protein
MAIYDDTFVLNWGSDLRTQFNWPDGAGGNANLTDCTVSLIDVHASLASALTAALTTPATGLISLALDWVDTIPRGRVANFRVRVTTAGGIDTTTNHLWLDVQ